MVRAAPLRFTLGSAFFLLWAELSGGCASSSSESERAEDPNRTLATAALAILAPKSEISFPPLPLAKRAHVIHPGSPIAGYELAFTDHSPKSNRDAAVPGACRLTCIGGDCAIEPSSENQLFLVQGKFVVSYSRMIGNRNRIIAFLASLKRSFEAPVIFLDCAISPRDRRGGTLDDLLAQLPAETEIDAKKNAPLSLTESLPGTLPIYEIATHRCYKHRKNPYAKAAVFVLTPKGIQSYDSTGHPLDYRIACPGDRTPRCTRIADYLLANGVAGCLY